MMSKKVCSDILPRQMRDILPSQGRDILPRSLGHPALVCTRVRALIGASSLWLRVSKQFQEVGSRRLKKRISGGSSAN